MGREPLSGSSPRIGEEAMDEHANHNTAELDRKSPSQKRRRRRLGEQVAVNMHTMGTSFVGKVRDVRQIAKACRGGRHGGSSRFRCTTERE